MQNVRQIMSFNFIYTQIVSATRSPYFGDCGVGSRVDISENIHQFEDSRHHRDLIGFQFGH